MASLFPRTVQVQGVNRQRVLWAPEETCAQLRQRPELRNGSGLVWGSPAVTCQGIEEATGVPAAKQQLKLVGTQAVAAPEVKTVWVSV